jgi:hypothetical protein
MFEVVWNTLALCLNECFLISIIAGHDYNFDLIEYDTIN